MNNESVGDRFQQDTKYSPDTLSEGKLDFSTKPPIYKEYPENKKKELPHFKYFETPGFIDILKGRKSVRRFADTSMDLEQLSYLLWASTGIQRHERGMDFRTVPSAGALFPIETYIVVNNVKDLPQGIYHYNIKEHLLEEIKTGDHSLNIAEAALGQLFAAEANVVFVWTAIFFRSKWKYNQRAYRYIYLDAGHIAQNLALAATAAGLGTCEIGALFDDMVNNLVEVDGMEESIILMCAVGKPS